MENSEPKPGRVTGMAPARKGLWITTLSLALGLLCHGHASGAARPVPQPVSLRDQLLMGVKAFNRGDFRAYLRDLTPMVGYNDLRMSRDRLFELNHDLKRSFPNLRMRVPRLRIDTLDSQEATASVVAEFRGEVANYENSGLGATYLERSQTTALYRKHANGWLTDDLQIGWNESFIEVGPAFGLMGFGNLPVDLAPDERYRLRLHAGASSERAIALSYAYALVPLSAVMEAAGAESVFAKLDFKPLRPGGIDLMLPGPSQQGSFAHLLVVNKTWNASGQMVPIAQKIYTRLVRVSP